MNFNQTDFFQGTYQSRSSKHVAIFLSIILSANALFFINRLIRTSQRGNDFKTTIQVSFLLCILISVQVLHPWTLVGINHKCLKVPKHWNFYDIQWYLLNKGEKTILFPCLPSFFSLEAAQRNAALILHWVVFDKLWRHK